MLTFECLGRAVLDRPRNAPAERKNRISFVNPAAFSDFKPMLSARYHELTHMSRNGENWQSHSATGLRQSGWLT